jgi:hypothetical protein
VILPTEWLPTHFRPRRSEKRQPHQRLQRPQICLRVASAEKRKPRGEARGLTWAIGAVGLREGPAVATPTLTQVKRSRRSGDRLSRDGDRRMNSTTRTPGRTACNLEGASYGALFRSPRKARPRAETIGAALFHRRRRKIESRSFPTFGVICLQSRVVMKLRQLRLETANGGYRH